ncbi:MAG: Flp pilus assembly protein CpaB [bacterium]
MKQRMVLVISVIVGLLAFWMTRSYFAARMAEIETERQQLIASERQVDVLVAKKDLPDGTVLLKKDLAAISMPGRAVSKNSITVEDQERIFGKKLKYRLDAGEALMWSYVDVPFRPGSGLAPVIPKGMRAISITIGGAAGVSGLLQPNDRVDIMGSFTFPSRKDPEKTEWVTLTLLQDVTLLATGQTLGKSDPGDRTRLNTGYSTVTVEVSPREAELLVFVENMRGHLTLALRNPEDVSYEKNLPEVNFDMVERELPELNSYRQQIIRHKGVQ